MGLASARVGLAAGCCDVGRGCGGGLGSNNVVAAMTEVAKDTIRSSKACVEIVDGRSLKKDYADILVTLEQAVATILIATQGLDPYKAAMMLNEGLVPGVEKRIALFQSKAGSK